MIHFDALLTVALALCPADPPVEQCGVPDTGPAAEPVFEHRWGGLVHDVFTLDGFQVWTAEGGGRIRYSADAGATWCDRAERYSASSW